MSCSLIQGHDPPPRLIGQPEESVRSPLTKPHAIIPRGYDAQADRAALGNLAHLLDERIGLRVGLDGEEFASFHLGVAGGEMVTTTAQLSGLGFQLAALAFARDLADHPPVALVGETPSDAPRYEILEFGAERRRIPYEVTAAFAAVSLVVALEPEDWRDTSVLKVYSRTGDADAARAWLSARSELHPDMRGFVCHPVPFGKNRAFAVISPGFGRFQRIGPIRRRPRRHRTPRCHRGEGGGRCAVCSLSSSL